MATNRLYNSFFFFLFRNLRCAHSSFVPLRRRRCHRRRRIQFVHETLVSTGDLAEIAAASESHFISLADLESDVCVPELRHFVYKSEVNSQLVIPACPPPYNTYARQKALHRRYQAVNAKLCAQRRRHVIYFEAGATDCVLAWVRSGEFEMYCVFSALCHKQHAVTAANRVLRFIQREQANLFIVNAPSW